MPQPPHTDLKSHRFNQRVGASEVISVFTGFCHCGRQQVDFYYFHQNHVKYSCPGETYYEYKKSSTEEEKRDYFDEDAYHNRRGSIFFRMKLQ